MATRVKKNHTHTDPIRSELDNGLRIETNYNATLQHTEIEERRHQRNVGDVIICARYLKPFELAVISKRPRRRSILLVNKEEDTDTASTP